MKAEKYEVLPFGSEGFRIAGGGLQGMFIKEKEDAERIAAALNKYDKLKLQMEKINQAKQALKEINKMTGKGA